MALVLANRVQETTATTGTGTITLAGAVSGYQSFAAIGNANTTYYTITSGTAWEVGIGTYTSSGTTLSRDTVLSSSAGGTTKITLAGTSTVFADYPAEKSVNYDASSNVGIGTTSPTAKLEVYGGTTGELRVTNSTNGFQIYTDASATTLGTYTNIPLVMRTNSTERMRITSTGDVGIGTSAPGGKLHVVTGTNDSILFRGPISLATGGSMYGVNAANTAIAPLEFAGSVFYFNAGSVGIGMTAPPQLLAVGNTTDQFGAGISGAVTTAYFGSPSSGSGGIKRIAYDRASGNMSFIGGSVASPSTQMTLDNSGNVGIGTASPSYKLVVSAASNTNPIAVISGSTKGIRLGADANGGIIEGVDNTGAASYQPMTLGGADIRLTTSSTERMRIDTSGNVLIGTTSPAAKLAVVGGNGIYVSGSGAAGYNVAQFVNDSAITLSVGVSGSTAGGWTTNLAHLGTVSSSPLAFGTNSTERIRITSAGLVGIGTSAPAYTLDVNGNINFGATLLSGSGVSTGDCAFELGSNRSASGNAYMDFHATAGTDYEARILRGSGTNGAFTISNTGTGDMALYNTGAAAMTFSTTATERMRIDSSGNVGIGTSSPAGKLHTQLATSFSWGSNWGTGTAVFGGASLSTGALGLSYNDTDGAGIGAIAPGVAWKNIAFYSNQLIFNTSGTGERMRITPAGLVGIGTTTPSQVLDVVGIVLAREDTAAGATPVILRNSNTGNNTTKSSSALFQGTDTVGTVKNIGSIGFFPDDANYIGANLRFLVRSGDAAPTERMRVTSAGVVAIGGGSFNAALGDMVLSKQSAGTATFALESQGSWNSTIASSAAGNMIFSNPAATERMRLDSSGVLIVGTTASEGPSKITCVSTASGTACTSHRNSAGAGAYLDLYLNAAGSAVIGSITNNGNTGVLYNITSDSRLKKNIADADNASSLIDALQVRKFDWKETGSHQRYGFIAQELLEVAPEAVSQPTDPDDMMGVDYSKLVPMLIKEVQSLRARVAQLEGN